MDWRPLMRFLHVLALSLLVAGAQESRGQPQTPPTPPYPANPATPLPPPTPQQMPYGNHAAPTAACASTTAAATATDWQCPTCGRRGVCPTCGSGSDFP